MRRSARIGCGLAIAVLLTAVGPGTRLAAAQSGATASDAVGSQDGATVNRAKPGIATTTSKVAPTATAKTTAAKKTVTPKVASAAKQPATTAKKPTTAAGASAAAAERDSLAGPRTLDEIYIQGEIPVPQVLFITARDQRRFLDFQHRRYLKNSQRIGETTVLPSWIAVTPGARPQEPPR